MNFNCSRIVDRLSNMTTVRGCHLIRAWKSWPIIICCRRKFSKSLVSVSFIPWMSVMNSPLRKRHLLPVTGWTRTSGWTFSTGSLRTRPPACRAWEIIFAEECTALRLSRRKRNVGERRLVHVNSISSGPSGYRWKFWVVRTYWYASSVAAKTVSPPTSGACRRPSIT
jgi:hypothetical protein